MFPGVLIPAGTVLIFAGGREERGSDVEAVLSHVTSLVIDRSRGKGFIPLEKTRRRETSATVYWEWGLVSYLVDASSILLCLQFSTPSQHSRKDKGRGRERALCSFGKSQCES